MTEEEFQNFGASIQKCLSELREASGPVIVTAAGLTNDSEARATAVTMLVNGIIPVFYHAFDDEQARSALIQTLENMASEMRRAEAQKLVAISLEGAVG